MITIAEIIERDRAFIAGGYGLSEDEILRYILSENEILRYIKALEVAVNCGYLMDAELTDIYSILVGDQS